MDKTPVYYVFLGLLIGSGFGAAVGALGGDVLRGMQLGAISGVFIGWIMTAPAFRS